MSNENQLPHKIDVYRFADQGIRLKGIWLIHTMQRLSTALSALTGEVKVDIQFGRDGQRIRFMQGEYHVTLVLNCQRCMQPFDYPLSGNFLFGMVSTEEEAEELPTSYDAVIVKEGMLVVHDVIEDEIIVSLPIVSMHPEKDCHVGLPFVIDTPETEQPETDNPFNVIEVLRSKRNVDDK